MILTEDVTPPKTPPKKNILQRSKNVLEVAADFLEVIARRCYNISGMSRKLVQEDVTTYQEMVLENADRRTLLHPAEPPPPNVQR